ncbi:MAG: symmetrical bis(5'-nucleosyl)-tetraphosphatase [Pseudomonadota bacterium]
MAIYAIGDLQGCYDELCRLLDKIRFDPGQDILWFCGDLVNRGPDSLQTLRYVKSLGSAAVTVLGNHDLHLLALHHGVNKVRDSTSLKPILQSPDRDELMDWLQQQPLLHYDKKHKAVLVHAGIHPEWGLSKARKLAAEVEQAIQGPEAYRFYKKMYGNQPDVWDEELRGRKRLRCITNILTRMRYFESSGELNFEANGSPRQTRRKGLIPWYAQEARLKPSLRILFGHWSSLPVGCYGRCFALDGGCVWGGHMVALRIDNEAEEWFFVDSQSKKSVK